MDKLKSILPLNFAILSNPINWVIVFLMIAIAALGFAYIMQSRGNAVPTNTTGAQ